MKKTLLGLLFLSLTLISCEPDINGEDFYVKRIERSNARVGYYLYYIGPREGNKFYFRIYSSNQNIELGDKIDITAVNGNGEIKRF